MIGSVAKRLNQINCHYMYLIKLGVISFILFLFKDQLLQEFFHHLTWFKKETTLH